MLKKGSFLQLMLEKLQ